MKTSLKWNLMYGLLVLGVILTQTGRVSASYSLSLTIYPEPGASKIRPAANGNTAIMGNWTTNAGDTLSYLDVYLSTDGGITFNKLTALPLTTITGIGLCKTTWFRKCKKSIVRKAWTSTTSTSRRSFVR